MIVGFSWAQLQAVRYWGTELHKKYLSEERHRTPRGSHEVAMPAIGWRLLGDRLVREAFHATTGRHRKTRNQRDGVPATRAALQKIEWALAHTAMHPALRNQAVPGAHGDVLIAWPGEDGMSLFPVPGTDPVYFVPYLEDVPRVGQVTKWQRRDKIDFDLPQIFPNPLDHLEFLMDVGVAVDNDG